MRRSDHRFWRELSELAFDYFDLRFTSSTASRFENIFTRGLLAGRSYGEGGDRSRGVWGLYGGYDYVSPRIFRVSSVALSVGNTAQWKAGGTRAIQSTVLAGIGYGASGGFVSSASTDYHYGLTPQVLGAVRFIQATESLWILHSAITTSASMRPREADRKISRAPTRCSLFGSRTGVDSLHLVTSSDLRKRSVVQ